MKILVYHRDAEIYHRMIHERFPDMEIVAVKEKDLHPQQIADADILLANHFPSIFFKEAKRLRWVQSSSAGVDQLLGVREYLSGVVVTNTRGIHRQLMADFAFGAMTMLPNSVAGKYSPKRDRSVP